MVTVNELKDLPHLPGEITIIDNAMESLKHPQYLKGMDSRQKAECVAALTDLISIYQERRRMCVAQLEKLRAFMDGIDDPFTRELFRLRYERALEWARVSSIIDDRGFYYAEDSLRTICSRYLKKYNMEGVGYDEKRAAAADI